MSHLNVCARAAGQSTNRGIDESKDIKALRAFTLVEMLIVVAILAILMTITFKLVGVGDEEAARANTLVKLQRIENCLSGYYAAFGCYPPVKKYGSWDVYCKVDEAGDQDSSKGRGRDGGEYQWWRQVRAACQCQPFGCEYPGDSADNEAIGDWAKELRDRLQSGQYPGYSKDANLAAIVQQGLTGPTANGGGFRSEWDSTEWRDIKLFKFGMLSYLLPRYLFMMGGDKNFFGVNGNPCAQWDVNNDKPCDPFDGEPFDGWDEVRDGVPTEDNTNPTKKDMARIANIPSQAVCARWIPNLEGMCDTDKEEMELFGIKVSSGYSRALESKDPDTKESILPDLKAHRAPNGTYYTNAELTITDGWGNEFYYYSPAPYQSYVVWSAGKNGKTFPPWMPLDKLESQEDKEWAIKWMADDIKQLSH